MNAFLITGFAHFNDFIFFLVVVHERPLVLSSNSAYIFCGP